MLPQALARKPGGFAAWAMSGKLKSVIEAEAMDARTVLEGQWEAITAWRPLTLRWPKNGIQQGTVD
jgi:hypothetical protein